jgi:hypothetical protein
MYIILYIIIAVMAIIMIMIGQQIMVLSGYPITFLAQRLASGNQRWLGTMGFCQVSLQG